MEKTKNKSGDSKRVVKSEKEIKKNKDYNAFISEITKAFSIPKNKFMIIGLTEDEDENPINEQDDLDSYLEDLKEFMIIMEEGSAKTNFDKKSEGKKKKNNDSENENGKKDNDNDSNKDGDEKNEDKGEGVEEDDYLKKINIKINLEISEQEIETIMNSVKIPEIDDINDDIEFDIEQNKENLNNANNTKFEDFKKIFEKDIKNIITEKSNIIKNNISQLVLNTQKDQEKNFASIDEESSSIKKDFDEIIKNTNDMNEAIGDLKYRLTGEKNNFEGSALNMIIPEPDDVHNNEAEMIKFELKEKKKI